MTRNPPRSAKSNAGDRKGVSENASRDALSGRIGLFGRAIRPARSTTRGSEAEIAWKVAFGCFSLTGGKPNGECRLIYTVTITPRSEREAMITKRVEASSESGETIYDFRSGSYSPKVISLPINVPVYRMENCRAFSAQQTQIARQGLDKGFFSKGQELTTAQQAQHEILDKSASKERIRSRQLSLYCSRMVNMRQFSFPALVPW